MLPHIIVSYREKIIPSLTDDIALWWFDRVVSIRRPIGSSANTKKCLLQYQHVQYVQEVHMIIKNWFINDIQCCMFSSRRPVSKSNCNVAIKSLMFLKGQVKCLASLFLILYSDKVNKNNGWGAKVRCDNT